MNGVKFQQDIAPDLLRHGREINFELLEWPAQYPDLIPIEHLCGLLKRNARRYSINTKEVLKRRLRQE